MPSERSILDRIRRRAHTSNLTLGITLGIGDDCAIYTPTSTEELVFTTDLLIEDRHFRFDTHTPAQAGHKALARGLSDIAAMGATPRFCLVSLAVSPRADEQWISRFYTGLLALARSTGTVLAGGDLARADKIVCDIVVCGSIPKGESLRRSTAQPGDSIYVSGLLGASALGLATQTGLAWKRHLRPEPRLRLGQFLRPHATAAMDLSDGLSLDLARLCLESKVSAAIVPPPLYPGASLEQALNGGEDYELLFTARTPIPAHFQNLPLTRIGEIRKGRPGRITLGGKPLPPSGFDHFATNAHPTASPPTG